MIKNIKIYGERNSGTNLLQAICSGSSFYHNAKTKAFDIPIVTRQFGWKHFFGFHDESIKKDGEETLFIGIVRNPYDWTMALYNTKHHIPMPNRQMNGFLLNEWYSVELKPTSKTYGKEIMGDRNWHTGKRYKNIFELRKNKLLYLCETMPKIAKNYVFIRYEDLCLDVDKIMNNIKTKYNLKINDKYLRPKQKPPYKVPTSIKNIIDQNIDWEIELYARYTKR